MQVTLSLLPLATTLGAVLAAIDAILRMRRSGVGALLAILELLLALLLFVAAFAPVQDYVSTTIPLAYLSIPLEIVLIVLLFLKSSRKGGLVWLTAVAAVVNGITAVLTLMRLGG